MELKKLFRKREKKKGNDALLSKHIYSSRQKDVETLKAGVLAQKALEVTKHILTLFGPRPSGSESCLKAAEKIKDLFSRYCDITTQQDFIHHGDGYISWIGQMPYVYLLVIILLFFGFPVTAGLIYVFFAFMVIRQFILYRPISWMEKRFKGKKGRNVHGIIEPEEEVTHTVLFSAHHDSAPISTFSRASKKDYVIKVLFPFGLFFMVGILSFVQLFVEIFTGRLFAIGFPPVGSVVFLVIFLVCFPLLLPLKKFFSDEFSPGAGDNLASVAMEIELARFFHWRKENGKALKHTRVIFASFDGEEEGLRGSRAWFDKYSSLLKHGLQLNFDCLYDSSELIFLDTDINGTQQLSVKFAGKCKQIAQAMGYKVKTGPLPMFCGGTDAAEGYRAGIEACTLMGVSCEGRSHQYYHTEEDTLDKIDIHALEKAISLSIRLCQIVDEGRFDEEEIILDAKTDEDEVSFPELDIHKLTKKD
jgi:hypothetical protein